MTSRQVWRVFCNVSSQIIWSLARSWNLLRISRLSVDWLFLVMCLMLTRSLLLREQIPSELQSPKTCSVPPSLERIHTLPLFLGIFWQVIASEESSNTTNLLLLQLLISTSCNRRKITVKSFNMRIWRH